MDDCLPTILGKGIESVDQKTLMTVSSLNDQSHSILLTETAEIARLLSFIHPSNSF